MGKFISTLNIKKYNADETHGCTFLMRLLAFTRLLIPSLSGALNADLKKNKIRDYLHNMASADQAVVDFDDVLVPFPC